jgi:hypothetical protein
MSTERLFCTATRAENLQKSSKEADSRANGAAKCSLFFTKIQTGIMVKGRDSEY